MPNPTTPVDVAEDDAEILAEGWRVLQRLKDADNEMKWEPDYGAQAIVALAQDNAQAWAFDNFEFLLRAASENVSLREQVVSANEQRDAAVREAERLKTALKFYSEGFIPRPAKRNKYGLNPGLEWKPSEALLDDCGNVAMEALASAAPGGAK